MPRLKKRQPINIDFSSLPENVLNSMQSDEAQYGLVRNEDSDDPAELLVFDQIGKDFFGEGVSATDVVDFLRDNDEGDVVVRINSPGGLAWEGITIHNALVQHKGNVTTRVEGVASSAASIIMVAGNKVEMMENAVVFVHRALNIVAGNQNDMRANADFLDTVDNQIIRTFMAKTSMTRNEITDLMDGDVDGTTFDADEAVENGFADTIIKIKDSKSKGKNKSKAAKSKKAEAANNTARNQTQEYLTNLTEVRLRKMELERHSEIYEN